MLTYHVWRDPDNEVPQAGGLTPYKIKREQRRKGEQQQAVVGYGSEGIETW